LSENYHKIKEEHKIQNLSYEQRDIIKCFLIPLEIHARRLIESLSSAETILFELYYIKKVLGIKVPEKDSVIYGRISFVESLEEVEKNIKDWVENGMDFNSLSKNDKIELVKHLLKEKEGL